MKQTILLALTGLLGLVSCSVYDVRMGEVDGMYSMDKMAGAGPALAVRPAHGTGPGRAVHGVSAFFAQAVVVSRAGNQPQQAGKSKEYRLFHHFQSVKIR